jgi:hypothetical protein
MSNTIIKNMSKKDKNANFMEELKDNIINQKKIVGDDNSLKSNDIFRLLDLHYYKEFYTYRLWSFLETMNI